MRLLFTSLALLFTSSAFAHPVVCPRYDDPTHYQLTFDMDEGDKQITGELTLIYDDTSEKLALKCTRLDQADELYFQCDPVTSRSGARYNTTLFYDQVESGDEFNFVLTAEVARQEGNQTSQERVRCEEGD